MTSKGMTSTRLSMALSSAAWATPTARAAVNILRGAGVNVGIAGNDESCCGGRAYEMGHEADFLAQAAKSMEVIKKSGAKTLVTSCAMCFQTYSVLYDRFGLKGKLEVLHSSQFIADLLAKAEAFAAANSGKYLICNQGLGNADAYHVAPVYFGHGVPEYVDDQGVAYLNTPEALAAGKWMVEFSKVAPAETSHDICKAMITEGDAGAWWTGPWAIADLEAAGIDYGIVPMGKPFVGIKALLLSKNAVDRGNEAVAIDIMKYFTSGPVQAKIAAVNKTIPASTEAMKDAAVQALPTLRGFGASLNLGVPMANTPFAGAQWGPVGDATTAIWTGAQTPEEALAAAQAAIEKAIADMK